LPPAVFHLPHPRAECREVSTLADESAKLALVLCLVPVLARRAPGLRKWRNSMTMNAQQLIILAVVGIIAGFLASFIVPGPRGLLGYLIAGLIGGVVGGWLFNAMGWRLNLGNDIAEAIVTSAIGAIVVLFLARLLGVA
jgi:uncharacterized membrane protein YeaQ/YmgE (transglycosylase-associated protein family)